MTANHTPHSKSESFLEEGSEQYLHLHACHRDCLWKRKRGNHNFENRAKNLDVLIKHSMWSHIRHPIWGVVPLYCIPGGTSDKEPACQCRRHKQGYPTPSQTQQKKAILGIREKRSQGLSYIYIYNIYIIYIYILYIYKILWRRALQPTQVFLPRESPWTEEPGRLHSPWGRKASDMTEKT